MYHGRLGRPGAHTVAVGRGKGKADGGESVTSRLKAEKVRWVQLFYTDVFGGFNMVSVPREALEPERQASARHDLRDPAGELGPVDARRRPVLVAVQDDLVTFGSRVLEPAPRGDVPAIDTVVARHHQ